MYEIRNKHRILLAKSQGKKPLGDLSEDGRISKYIFEKQDTKLEMD
jgi:hypothetical protein